MLSRFEMIEKYKNCTECIVCKAIDEEQSAQFFNRLEAIWNWASANPLEGDVQEQLNLDEFLKINRFEVLGEPETLKGEITKIDRNGSKEVIQGHRLGQFAPDYLWSTFSKKKITDTKKVQFSSEGLQIANITTKNCDMTVNDLLKNIDLLHDWQKKEHAIFECKKFLKLRSEGKNLLPNPNKQRKAYTYIQQKCFIDEDGLLRRPKELPSDAGEPPRGLLVVPPLNNTILMKIFHNTFGHNSCAHFEKVSKEHFCTTGFSEAVKNFIGQCAGCLAMKNKPKIFKPLKEIDIPDRIGKSVLIDEMHFYKASDRSGQHSQKYRFLFATESLTRFSKLYPVIADLTSSKLIKILKQIKADFGQRTLDHMDLIIRADQHQVHKSVQSDPILKDLKIKIEIHPKTSLSKNHIPELDGRGNSIARIIRDELSKTGKSREEIAWAAERRYNNLRGDTHFSPLELWTGCRQITGVPFKINLQQLINRIKQCRTAARAVKDRQAAGNRHRLPIQFIPFTGKESYEKNSVVSPLKLGDWVLLDKPFDKNDHNPYYKIVSNDSFPTGIDWEHKLILTEKIGLKKQLQTYCWHFDAISGVLDGSCQKINSFRFTGQKIEKGYLPAKQNVVPKLAQPPKSQKKAESFPIIRDFKKSKLNPEWFAACREDFEYFRKFLDRQKQECLAELIRVQQTRPQDMINSIDTLVGHSTADTLPSDSTPLNDTKFVPNSYLDDSQNSVSTVEPEPGDQAGLDPARGSTPRRGQLCDIDQANVLRGRTRSQMRHNLNIEPEPEQPAEPDPADNDPDQSSIWSYFF